MDTGENPPSVDSSLRQCVGAIRVGFLCEPDLCRGRNDKVTPIRHCISKERPYVRATPSLKQRRNQFRMKMKKSAASILTDGNYVVYKRFYTNAITGDRTHRQ